MQNIGTKFNLENEIAIITGGAGIIGQRFSLAMLSQGAKVIIIDNNDKKIHHFIQKLNTTKFQNYQGYCIDITDHNSLLDLRNKINSDIGKPSILVNNAATKSENFFEPFENYSLYEWNQIMETNLTGAMLMCQVFGSQMAECKKGSIINILSIYGIVSPDQRIYNGSLYEGKSINTPAVYSTSKAALWGLTRYLATYWSDKDIRVNAITPGGVFSGQNDVFVKKYSQRVPLGRMAEEDDLCGALIFLASSNSSYVTGQNIIVDGGHTVW